MEPTVVVDQDIVLIEEDTTDYSESVNRISRSAIKLCRWGDHCGMHINKKGFPIVDYQIGKLPSGNVQIAVIMEFSSDSVYWVSDSEPDESS